MHAPRRPDSRRRYGVDMKKDYLVSTSAEKIDRDAYADTQEMLQAMNEAGVEARFVTLPDFKQDSIPTYFMVEENGSGREVLPFLREQLGDGG